MYKITIRFLVCLVILFPQVVIADKLKIAIIYPMEGLLSNPMCLAEAVINEASAQGLPVQLIKLDNKDSVLGSILAAKRAIDLKVDLVIGTRISQETLAIADLFEQAKIPFITPLAITQGKSYVMSFYPPIDWYSSRLAHYLVTKAKVKKLAVVTNVSLPHSQAYQETLIAHVKALQPNVEIVQFDVIDGESDFQTLAEKIQLSKADVLYLPLYFFQSANIIAMLGKMNPSIKIFINRMGFVYGSFINGEKIYSELQFLKKVSYAAPHMSISMRSVAVDNGPREVLKGHCLQLMEKFCDPHKNVLESAAAYDNLMFILQVLKDAPSLRGKHLLTKIKQCHFQGLTKTIAFNSRGEAVGDYMQLTIKNGKFIQENLVAEL